MLNIHIHVVKRLFLPIRTKFNDDVKECEKYKSYHLLVMVKVQSSLDETLFSESQRGSSNATETKKGFLGSLSIPPHHQIVTSVALPNIVPFYRNSEITQHFLNERLTVSIIMFVDYDLKLKKDIFATNHCILKRLGALRSFNIL